MPVWADRTEWGRKTTVFNLLTGVYKPTEGIITLDGENIVGKKTIDINKAGIARTFQNIRLFKGLSVLDNVKVGLHNHHKYSTIEGILRLPKYYKVEKEMDEKALELLSVFGLDKYADTLAAIAGGMAYMFYKHIPERLLKLAYCRLPAKMLEINARFDAFVNIPL